MPNLKIGRYDMKFLYYAFLSMAVLFAVRSHAVDNLGSFKLPSAVVPKSSIGVIRVFCYEQQRFISFSGTRGFAAIEPLVADFGTANAIPLDCSTNSFSIISEQQVTASTLSKSESGVARIISVDKAKLILFTAKNGGGSLRQYK